MPENSPYDPPRAEMVRPTPPPPPGPRSIWHIIALVVLATVVAFAVMPGIGVAAWLLGYGSGGMRELQAGYPTVGMIKGSLMLCPIHYLALLLPKRRVPMIIGYAVSLEAVVLMAMYWLLAAALIANV